MLFPHLSTILVGDLDFEPMLYKKKFAYLWMRELYQNHCDVHAKKGTKDKATVADGWGGDPPPTSCFSLPAHWAIKALGSRTKWKTSVL